MDLSSVGGAELTNTQYVKVLKPVLDGEAGFEFDQSLCGMCVAAKYRVAGTPEVMMDGSMSEVFGDYITGEMEMDALLALLQERWERAYDIPAGSE